MQSLQFPFIIIIATALETLSPISFEIMKLNEQNRILMRCLIQRPHTENIRGLNLAAVMCTAVQESRLPR
jgi:hypothetical protein